LGTLYIPFEFENREWDKYNTALLVII